jgi:WD40 repeat protein
VPTDRFYSLCEWNPPTLRRRLDLRGIGSLGLSGDGRTVVVKADSSTALILQKDAVWPRVLSHLHVECVAVSRDGTRAALSGHTHGINLVELPGGKILRTLKRHPGAVYALNFSAEGKRLLSAARTRPPVESMRLRIDGKDEKEPPPTPDDTVRVWDVDTGAELRRWEQKADAATLSADGRVMLAGCDDGKVRRLAVDTADELPPVAAHPGAVTAVAVSFPITAARRHWLSPPTGNAWHPPEPTAQS